MSRPLFSWRHAILESDLPATTRHVLLTLSCHMSDAGDSCFPTTARLAAETGLSERAVITHLQKAQELGWLKIGVHGFGGQKWKRHEYVVSVPQSMQKGTEPRSVASDAKALNLVPEGTEPHAEGTEPDDRKALNEVQCSTSVTSTGNSTKNSTGEGRASAPAPARVSSANERQGGESKPRGKRLVPVDWKPSPAVETWCEQKFPHIAAPLELEKFIDWARANDERFKDFDAAFRNWIRQADRFARRDGKVASTGGARRVLT